MSHVTFGTTLGGFGGGLVSGPTLCRWAEEIEQLGYDILFYRDHVLWHSPVLDPFTMLGAFAARTKKIKLGTGVLLLPLRNPTLVAKMIGTLDWLSGGRAILGVGVGGEFQKEYEACGIAPRERGRRATEGLRVIKELWTNPSATCDGQFLQFENARMTPRPLQQPHPPIWVGGRVDAALKRAGTYGDGWFAYFVTPERFRTSLDKALEHWHQREASSRTTFTGGVVLYFCIAPTYEAARANAVHTLSTEYNQSFDRIIDKYSALGPASECAATIQRYIEAGARHMTLLPAVPAAATMDQLRYLATDVLPHLRSLPSP